MKTIILLLILTACSEPKISKDKYAYKNIYKCTEAQMKLVKRDVKACSDSSMSWAEYCEVQARDRHCVRLENADGGGEK